MSEYIIKLPNGGAADECIRLRGYEKSLYGYELHEEIVRCRDCRHYDQNDEPSEVYPDRYLCDLMTNFLHPDGFCAWGERRERESAEVWNQWSADDVTCSEEL